MATMGQQFQLQSQRFCNGFATKTGGAFAATMEPHSRFGVGFRLGAVLYEQTAWRLG